MIKSLKSTLYSGALVLALCLTGCDSNEPDDGIEQIDLSPDDIDVSFSERREDDQLYMDITFKNESSYTLEGVSATVRLLEGDRVVASENVIYVDGLGEGQSVEEEAWFFNFYREDGASYECYEYDVEVYYIADPLAQYESEKSYPGTCG